MVEETLFMMVRLLFLLLLFVLIGRPLMAFLRRRTGFFRSFNAVQEFVFDVYFGAIILYIIASLPLHLFNYYALLAVLVMCSVIDLVQLGHSSQADGRGVF